MLTERVGSRFGMDHAVCRNVRASQIKHLLAPRLGGDVVAVLGAPPGHTIRLCDIGRQSRTVQPCRIHRQNAAFRAGEDGLYCILVGRIRAAGGIVKGIDRVKQDLAKLAIPCALVGRVAVDKIHVVNAALLGHSEAVCCKAAVRRRRDGGGFCGGFRIGFRAGFPLGIRGIFRHRCGSADFFGELFRKRAGSQAHGKQDSD